MMRMFKIELPVRVQEIDLHGNETEAEGQNLTVRITMGDKATCKDAVEALAGKLEVACNTIDIGDCT